MDRKDKLSALELQAAVIAGGWALWLLIGQPFGSLVVFHVAEFVSEWVWAMALLVAVTAHLSGYYTECARVRRGGLVLSGVIWMLMAGCILVASPRAPGTWTLWSLAASAIYAAAKL